MTVPWRYVGEDSWKDLISLDSLKGQDGSDGSDGSDGTDGKDGLSAYEIAVKLGFDGDELAWLESLKGQNGTNGTDGREVEFQVSLTHIQWRYVGEDSWKDLISLDSLKGQDGTDGSDGSDGTDGKDGLSAYEIAVKLGFEGDELAWLESLKGQNGTNGTDGREVEFQVSLTHIQWRYVGEDSWKDLISLDSLKGQDGTDGSDGIDGTDGKDGLSAYEIAVKLGFEGDEIAWLESLKGQNGTDGADGREVEFQVSLTHIQWRYVGEDSWTNLISLDSLKGQDGSDGSDGSDGKDGLSAYEIAVELGFEGDELAWLESLKGQNGTNGTDGREVEFQVSLTHIQWRYVGEEAWKDLISLDSLKGQDGTDGTDGKDGLSAYEIAVKLGFEGDELAWLESLKGQNGTNGTDGREVEFQVSLTHIQWRYVGEEAWKDLISLDSLKGQDGTDGSDGNDGTDGKDGLSAYEIAVKLGFDGDELAWLESLKGQNGTDGADGREVEFQVSLTHIQWRYVGEETWKDLISLDSLKGQDGTDGSDGSDGTDGKDGLSAYEIAVKLGFDGDELAWLESLKGQNGTNGTDGREVEFQVSLTHIQWRYVGEDSWKDLISLDSLKGQDGTDGSDGNDGTDGKDGLSAYEIAVKLGFEGDEIAWLESLKGQNGTNGTDGREVEFQVSLTHIQWRYVGQDSWTNLISLDSLKGQNGLSAYEIAVKLGFEGDEAAWLESLKGEQGVSIVSIQLTSSNNNVDTYTITYSDGTTSTFEVTNGVDGATPTITIGENGNWFINNEDTGVKAKGEDGYTPSISIGSNGNWYVDDEDTGVSALAVKQEFRVENGILQWKYENESEWKDIYNLEEYLNSLNSKLEYPEDYTHGLSFVEIIGYGYAVYGYFGYDGDIVIPNTYRGKNVIAIGTSAFEGIYINSIKIPETIRTISKDAFLDATVNTIIYLGNEERFNNIYIADGNDALYEANIIDSQNASLCLHKYDWFDGYPATCLESGLTDCYGCIKCNVVITESTVIDAFGHELAYYEAVDATCTKDGHNAYEKCYRCDYTTYEVIEALGHNVVINSAVLPTCSSVGYTEGSYCDRCEEVYVKQEEISMINHTFDGDSCVNCGCEYFSQDLDYEIVDNYTSKYVVVVGNGNNTNPDIVIPAYYKGLPVTQIGYGAFSSLKITSVRFLVNSNLEVIGSHAFEQCTNLTSVELPEGLTTIGDNAFVYCVNLEFIELPESLTVLGGGVFQCCYNLSSIEIPANVTEISSCLFNNCASLQNIVLSNNIKTIKEYAFSYCTSLETIVIPQSVTKIENYAFNYCSSLSIYAEHESEPFNWYVNWNSDNLSVYWSSHWTLDENGNPYPLHEVVIDEAVAATCTTAGLTEGSHCSVCNEVLVAQEVVEALGHAEVVDQAVAATCTTTGLTEGKHCSVCNEILVTQQVVAALGHTNSDKVKENNVLQTCTTTGSYDLAVYCSVCGAELSRETVVVEALGHTEVIDEAVAPTCTLTGLTEGKHCSVCDEVLVAQQVVPALGHTEVIDEAVASTCTENGLTEGSHCGVCDEIIVEQKLILASHKYEDYICSVCNYHYYSEGLEFVLLDNDTYEVKSYNGNESLVVIPAIYDNKTVTSIGVEAFYSCKKIENIVIPYTVIEIKTRAFYQSNLKSIEIPDTVIKFGSYSFWGNSSLVTLKIGDGIEIIGNSTFYGCTSLKYLEIGKNVSSISTDAFAWCESLESIVVDGDNPVYDSRNNCNAIIITATNELFIGSNNTVIPDSVTTISKGAFTGLNIEEIYIPDNVTLIGESAFYSCKYLNNVIIGKGISVIQNDTFIWCSRLTNITLTKNIERICSNAFYGCESLSNVNYEGTQEQWNQIDIRNDNGCLLNANIICHVHDELSSEIVLPTCETGGYTKYICSCGETYYGNYVEALGHTEVIDEAVDATCTTTGLTEGKHCSVCNKVLVAQQIVEALGHTEVIDEAIDATCTQTGLRITTCLLCDYYKEEIIDYLDHEMVGSECVNCDYYCTEGLEFTLLNDSNTYAVSKGTATDSNIVIPQYYNRKLVTSIGLSAFYGCSNLTSIAIPEGVTSIGSYAFSGCSKLTSIVIPEGVTSIGSYAFSGCSKLTSIVIPEGVTSIGSSTFLDCSKLTSIVIPEGVTSIGSSAFRHCSNLTSIEIPYSVISIEEGAFYYCSSLTSITIPEGVTNIEEQAFIYCMSLTSVVIPEGVTSIGEYAFCRCDNLKYVYYTGTQEQWNNITIDDYNDKLSSDIIYHYSNTQPTTSGNYWHYKCDGVTPTVWDDTLGHTIVVEETPATCTQAGLRITTCLLCDYYEQKVIEALGHTEVIDEAVSATCTETGLTEGSHCSVCDEVLVAQQEVPMFAHDYVEYVCKNCNFYYYSKGLKFSLLSESDTYSVSKGTATDSNIVIPYYYEGKLVTHIDDDAFYNNYSLENIVLPSSIISIGSHAFYNCASLINIEIPNSVTSIGSYAFLGCSSLESITLPFIGAELNGTSNTHFGYIFGSRSYSYNDTSVPSSLKEVTITGETCIGSNAFYGCANLTSIKISNSVTSIGDLAFYNCTSLINIEIPNSVTSIGSYAFSGCSDLTSIEIPNSVISIGDRAFYNCVSLIDIEISNNVTSIEYYAFYNCASLINIEIPNSVTSIGSHAFSGCSNLTSIKIPNSVTSIGGSAFSDCNSLESITLPFIGAELNGTKNTHFGYIFGASYYSEDTRVPSSLKEVTITGGTCIGERAFYYCESLESIKIPNSITSIGGYAFYRCSNLTNINIPNSVTSIGYSALSSCSSLESITLPFVGSELNGTSNTHFGYIFGASGYYDNDKRVPSSLKEVIITDGLKIDSNAFYGCEYLMSVEIPSSVNKIGECSFAKCNSLERIIVDENNLYYDSRNNCNAIIETATNTMIVGCKYTNFPEDVTSIGDYAFYSCVSLTNIEIPSSITSIGKSAFSNCSSLETVNLSDNLLSIGDYAFYNCASLTNIEIPSSVTSIGESAFSNCSSLETVNLSDGLLSVGKDAFYNCASLTNIEIPSSVTSIGESAFSNCSSLETVNLSDGLLSVGDYAFSNSNRIISIEIPKSVTSIGFGAFKGCNSFESMILPFVGETLYGATYTHLGYIFGATLKSDNASYVPSSLKEVIITNASIIGEYAFSDCSSIQSIIIPDSVTYIGYLAFSGCSSLTNIVVPNNVTSIGYNAFSDCSSLESITLPFIGNKPSGSERFGYIFNSFSLDNRSVPSSLKKVTLTNLTSIKESAFKDCSSLTSIVIPNSVISISPSAFSGCTLLENIVVDEENSHYDSRENCNAIIESVTNTLIIGCKDTKIPDGVITIGESAFSNCTSLTSINIPNSVEYINSYAFSKCTSLTNIVIPKSVRSIIPSAFSGCTLLENIVVDEENSHYDSRENCNAIIESVTNTLVYGCKNTIIPDSIIYIGSSAFSDCSSLTSINIPNSVVRINSYAFSNCTSLTSIVIPKSVTIIDFGAFLGCSSLESIVVDEENLYYDSRENCNAIIKTATNTLVNGCKNTIIPDSVTEIESYAFYKCTSLTSIVIPNSISIIGTNAFSGCISLESITIPGSVTSISRYAFAGCISLTNIEILEGVTIIGSDAFDNCSSLKTITIPKSVTSIGDYAFNYCTSLETVYYTGTIEEWGKINKANAFYNFVPQFSVICHIHEFSESVLIEPTCEEKGYVIYTCSCGESYIDSYVDELGHEIIVDSAVSPTCTLPGLTEGVHCGRCDYKVDQEVLESLGHSYTHNVTTPTCIEKGYTTHICHCGESYIDSYVDELGHYIVEDKRIEPTCTTTGLTEGKHCSVCKEVLVAQQVIPALGHTEVIDEVVAPTCTTTGLTEGKHCSVCNEVLVAQENIPALGHKESEAVVENNVLPTCTVDGSYDLVVYCSVCGAELSRETVVVEALGHTEVIDKAVEPTCTTTGLTEGKHCSVCNAVLVAQQVVSALGHNEVIDEAVVPTCTESGLTEGTHCVTCGEITIQQETLSPIGHRVAEYIKEIVNYSMINDTKYPFSISGDEIVSQNKSNNSSSTYIIKAERDFTLELEYKVSSESGYDYLIIKHNTTQKVKTSGTSVTTYQKINLNLTKGDTVSITYSKDASQSTGNDCCYVKLNTPVSSLLDSLEPRYIIVTEEVIKNLRICTEDFICDVCNDVIMAASGNDHAYVYHASNPSTCMEKGYSGYYTCSNDFCNYKSEYDEYEIAEHNFVNNICTGCQVHITSKDLVYSLNNDGNSYTVEGIGECSESSIVLNMYNNKPITHIQANAFNKYTNLTNITLPSSINTIGEDAFIGCTNLENVYINDIVSWCNITFEYSSESEDGVTDYWCDSNPLKYAENLYVNGVLTTSIVIPEGVEQISPFAFYFSNIKSLKFPSSLKEIGTCAFYSCPISGALEFPEGFTKIGHYVFTNCSSITSVKIPSTLNEIGDNTFDNCTSLNAVYISDLVSWCNIYFNFDRDYDEGLWLDCGSNPLNIAHNLYLNGERIINLVIPEEVTTLSDFAFQGGNFSTVKFSSNMTKIPNGAFQNCANLYSVTIPSTITSIGYYAFANCGNLSSLRIPMSVVTVYDYAIVQSSKVVVYCAASSKPSGWFDDWNLLRYPVVWGASI